MVMTFSAQNGEIFRSAAFPDRVSVEDKGGKYHTSETGRASGIIFRCRRKIPGGEGRTSYAFFTLYPTVLEQIAKNRFRDRPVDTRVRESREIAARAHEN